MPTERFLLVTDTPGIKAFVFGTDTLAEVRGASALLDRLNRHDTERHLRTRLAPAGTCETVFANGGTGQFVIHAPDRAAVEDAVYGLAHTYREETGGEVHVVWGLVPWPEGTPYLDVAGEAYFQMRVVRETASDYHCAPQMPLLVECASSSHLPTGTRPFHWGGESLMLSEAARRKREASGRAGDSGPWAGWVRHLAGPSAAPGLARDLRPRDAVELTEARRRGPAPARKGYVGLVYADGNAMGRFVQELDSRETCTHFSKIVDESIREACYQALDAVCAAEVAAWRADPANPRPLPADILLLGGDDLLVLLPADLALPFALHATEAIEAITRQRIDGLPAGPAREFFTKRLPAGRGMTVSCGVGLAPAKYPFYLLLDLAEGLLKSAKQGGSHDADRDKYWAPSYIDFHLVVGPAGADLEAVREDDYLVGAEGERPRTLRPYRREALARLCGAVSRLHQARLPRSKLQDLFDAALDPRETRGEMLARELFGRLREDRTHHERQALWRALSDVATLTDFPWCQSGDRTATALADLVEACDLFPREEVP